MLPFNKPNRPGEVGQGKKDSQDAGNEQVGDNGHCRLTGQDPEEIRARPGRDHQPARDGIALQGFTQAVLYSNQPDQAAKG